MSDTIDINVYETTEEVTINVTPNVIEVNINKITGGGGGTQTLAQTLVLGNTTGGENISISNGDAIILDNGSMLKKGTIDAGNGGAKGISQICGVGYEHKWEAGRLYIMNDGGTIIREVSHNLTYTPTATDDVTKGFVQNTRWILDNGDVYVCTDPTEDAAVWEIVNTGTTPTLQEVTDADNETTNAITLTNDTVPLNLGYDGVSSVLTFTDGGVDASLGFSGLNFTDIGGNYGALTLSGAEFLSSNKQTNYNAQGVIYNDVITNKGLDIQYPTSIVGTDKIQTFQDADGVIALLSDITGGGGVPYTGATQNVDLGTHKLLAKDLDINHPSGSGVAASITKGGSGEALKVVKSSGSGNAASITGGVTLLDELHLTTDLADAYISSASTWNAKQNALSYTPYRNLQTSQTAFTGSTVEIPLFTATIPAGTFNANDIIHILFNVFKTTTLGSYVLRLKINTTNTLLGAATIGTYNGANTTQIALMNRNLHLFGGNLYGYPFVSLTLISDIVGSVGTIGSTTLNPTNQFFIFGTVTLANASDNIIGTMFKISN
jgi:hypothetical protein